MKKRVLLPLFFALSVALIISTVFYLLLCKELRKTNRDNIGKLNYIMTDTTYYNTVFFGASCVHTDIDPVVFDSIAGTHSYNAGMDGIGVRELSVIIPKYLKSHGPPKNIFILLDETTLKGDEHIWYFPQYYPYTADPDFKPIIDQAPNLLLGRYFPPAAITFIDDPLKSLGLIEFLNKKGKSRDVNSINGFISVTSTQVVPRRDKKELDYFSSTGAGWDLLEQIVGLCGRNGIKVWFTNSPRYNVTIAPSSIKFFSILDTLCIAHHMNSFVTNSDENLAGNYFFADERHLNRKGADIYTAILAGEFIKPKSP